MRNGRITRVLPSSNKWLLDAHLWLGHECRVDAVAMTLLTWAILSYCNHGIAVTDSITTELDCKHKGLDREREMEKEWLGRCACFASRRGSHASTLLSNHLTVYINKHVAMEWIIKATRWTRYQLASYQTQSPQRRHWDNRRRRGQPTAYEPGVVNWV